MLSWIRCWVPVFGRRWGWSVWNRWGGHRVRRKFSWWWRMRCLRCSILCLRCVSRTRGWWMFCQWSLRLSVFAFANIIWSFDGSGRCKYEMKLKSKGGKGSGNGLICVFWSCYMIVDLSCWENAGYWKEGFNNIFCWSLFFEMSETKVSKLSWWCWE